MSALKYWKRKEDLSKIIDCLLNPKKKKKKIKQAGLGLCLVIFPFAFRNFLHSNIASSFCNKNNAIS